jgi:hypothetical protein
MVKTRIVITTLETICQFDNTEDDQSLGLGTSTS